MNKKFIKDQMSIKSIPGVEFKQSAFIDSFLKNSKASDSSESPKVLLDGNHQYSLDLERIEDLDKKLRSKIRQYESLSEHSKYWAHKWSYLMEILAKEEDMLESFKDILVVLKLRGYNI